MDVFSLHSPFNDRCEYPGPCFVNLTMSDVPPPLAHPGLKGHRWPSSAGSSPSLGVCGLLQINSVMFRISYGGASGAHRPQKAHT